MRVCSGSSQVPNASTRRGIGTGVTIEVSPKISGTSPAAGHAITIGFREPPRHLFELDPQVHDPNQLVFDLGEPGSITSIFLAKEPGVTMRLFAAQMKFEYEESFSTVMQLEAYERLLHDAMIGDRLLFISADEVERLWEVSEPLLRNPPPVHLYPQGPWGPPEADALIAPRHWHLSGHD